ncbi:hypothetical protein [Brevundimonas sp.]|uniref:hypothetical protein n=1 Tax=Brevundimonas sp. TaxID=1871086 RepID=UPI002D2348D1|nr:hypothetical protein [Brevundimonas sp.]HYD29225.1 hypothetical protein [Brevundimonas sp.]
MRTDRPLIAPPRLVRAALAGAVAELRLPAGHPLTEAIPGDRLYLREEVHLEGRAGEPPTGAVYAIDGAPVDLGRFPAGKVLPPAFQPVRYPGAWAARLWFRIVRKHYHPLAQISEAEAIAEGIPPAPARPRGMPAWVAHPTARGDRLRFWDAEHPDHPAAGNPTALALTLAPIDRPS